MSNMVEKGNWDEFRNAGLLWFVNRTLHLCGWAIVVVTDDDDRVTDVYPAKVRFRGFSELDEGEGFKKATRHIAENIDRLVDEAEDG